MESASHRSRTDAGDLHAFRFKTYYMSIKILQFSGQTKKFKPFYNDALNL